MSFPEFSIRSERSDRSFILFEEEDTDEEEGKISLLDQGVILRIFEFLGENLKAIPFVSKQWNRLLTGPFYRSLYNQKKPFGAAEWIKHFKINPGREPVIPLVKLVNFDPEVGALTLIVTRYTARVKNKKKKVKELSLANLFCCSLFAKQNPGSPYNYTSATYRHFFSETAIYSIEDLAPKMGNYWAYTPFPKRDGSWKQINSLFHLPLKPSRKMEASLPNLMGLIQTFITYYARTQSYSFGDDFKPGIHIVVKEMLTLKLQSMPRERSIQPYKLCVGFSERGISIKSVFTFSAHLNRLAFVDSEIMGLPPTLIQKVVKKIRKIRKGSTI